MEPGTVLTLDIEKATAGGRMLARHEGRVVLVWGAIPGERVRARVERVGKGVLYAETVEVLTASPDRRPATDGRCGGSVFAHIAVVRQVALKAEILQDAFRRIGRMPLLVSPEVVPSPEHGYRMRARLHVRDGRIGFYREGTHELCDAVATGQLLPATDAWIHAAEGLLGDTRDVAGIDLAENAGGDQRAYALELREGADPAVTARLADALGSDRSVTEHVQGEEGSAPLRLRRHARAFFQGNRYLLEPLVQRVRALVPAGPVVDLYAGVGLFGLALAASGAERVVLVEGDPVSGADLEHNAEPYGDRVRVERRSVEGFLRSYTAPRGATVIVDPPRTGLSRDTLAALLRMRPARLVYVSCDPATLARDTRSVLDAGYELEAITGFDLFPNTAHVEAVVAFTAGTPR